jgi:hypothetical protein
VLDNVTLYWLTSTAVSSVRLYWESKLAFFARKGVTLPTAVSVFPDEIYALLWSVQPRSSWCASSRVLAGLPTPRLIAHTGEATTDRLSVASAAAITARALVSKY